MTHLKRAGPPRAGPRSPLTTKAPVAAGALWLLHEEFVCVKHSAFSDGNDEVAMIYVFSQSGKGAEANG